MSNKSYVERDIVALREKLINMVKEETTTWTDFNETDLGMVYIEVLAGCADMLNYYLDKQANEVFLDRAEEPKNIRSILNTMNYRIPFKSPAEGTVNFINHDYVITKDVVIPKYTEMSSSYGDIKHFVTSEERSLIGGEFSVEVPVIQGAKKEVQETVSRLKKSWKYYLKAENLADKTVRIMDSYGEWTEVDDAFLEYTGGRKFSVHRDARDAVYIMFTWDWKVQLPKDDNEMVTIQYIETLGKGGRSPEYTIDKLLSKVTDVEGNDVTDLFIINNHLPISGGTDDPSIYEMIVNAKNSIKMMGKLVTLDDYSRAAASYPGVFRAVTQDWSVPDNYVQKQYKVVSWVVSDDETQFSEQFLNEMSKSLYNRGIAIIEYQVLQAEVVKFNINAQIKIRSDNLEFRSQIRQQVIENLKEAFGYGKLEFGQTVYWDDVRDVIKRTNPAITNVIMIEPVEDKTVMSVQYPALSDDIKVDVVGDYYGL